MHTSSLPFILAICIGVNLFWRIDKNRKINNYIRPNLQKEFFKI